jgi:diguanylate cyclase (GGDEF)-like protein
VSAHHATRVAHPANAQYAPLSRVWPFRLGGAYVVLALVLVASALSASMFAVFPPTVDTPRGFDATVATFCIALALTVLVVAPRTHDEWGLDACIAITATLAAATASWMPRAQGQLLVGFGLVLLGVYTAYYRPRARLVAHLAWMLAIYGVALLLAPHLTSPLYFGVVAGTVGGLSLLVSFLASRLRALAFRDPLTGLLNRHGFDLSIAPLVALAGRTGRPLTLGLIDLDGFKAYNDAYGHVAGDDLLVEVSAAWRSSLRDADLLARFGGDEFVLVLPGTTPEDARELEARLRRLHRTGWSVGFTQWHPGQTVRDALTNADAELYAEKRTRGRRTSGSAADVPVDLCTSARVPQPR